MRVLQERSAHTAFISRASGKSWTPHIMYRQHFQRKKTWSRSEKGSKYETTNTGFYDSYLLEMLNFDEYWIYIFVERWSVVLSGTFLWRDIFSSNLHTRRVKSWLLSSSINSPYLQDVFYNASIRYAYFRWTFHVLHEKMNTFILLQKKQVKQNLKKYKWMVFK